MVEQAEYRLTDRVQVNDRLDKILALVENPKPF